MAKEDISYQCINSYKASYFDIIMKIGEKILAKELFDLIDKCRDNKCEAKSPKGDKYYDCKCQNKPVYLDNGINSLFQNIGYGWDINHIAYNPRLHSDEPGFCFTLNDSKEGYIQAEVIDGPKIRQFLLEKNSEVYLGANLEFWKEKGFSNIRFKPRPNDYMIPQFFMQNFPDFCVFY
ncbi:Uncharacterised protein [uncultured archaeon]|nr:Uncharacterised protein [uncultured archaeon]